MLRTSNKRECGLFIKRTTIVLQICNALIALLMQLDLLKRLLQGRIQCLIL